MAKPREQEEKNQDQEAALAKAPEKAPEKAAKELAEAKAQKAAEDAALKRVCAAMGIDYGTVIQKEKEQAEDVEVQVELGRHIVRVNGIRYTGSFKCRRSFAEQLVHMAAARRMRLLAEKIGNKFEVEVLSEGPRVKNLGPVEGAQE